MVAKGLRLAFKLLVHKFRRSHTKKILVVAEFGQTGGTRTYFFHLIEFLHSKKENITLLVNESELDDEVKSLLRKYNIKNIPLDFDFWCTDFSDIPEGLTKRKLFSYQLSEVNMWSDLIQKHQFTDLILSVGYPEQYLYVFLLPIRILYILHTVPVKKADAVKCWILKNFLNKNKRILTVSQFAQKRIEKLWLQAKSSTYVRFIYNFYEPKFINSSKSERTPTIILTIGTVVQYKNPYLFIEVAKKTLAQDASKNIKFIWVGDGPLLRECELLTESEPHINFIGSTNNVEQYYEMADIYLQPSLLESHGIAVLGAMYYSLPCVVSNHGGLPESVEDQVNGFVIPVDDADYNTAVISSLIEQTQLQKKMGQEGKKIFNKKFTKDTWQLRMDEIFENYV